MKKDDKPDEFEALSKKITKLELRQDLSSYTVEGWVTHLFLTTFRAKSNTGHSPHFESWFGVV
jgi:hypothetical protein